jgi:hypothetical protein
MPRRSIWDDEEKNTPQANPVEQPAQKPFAPPPPTSILDTLKAEPPKKRSRDWDKQRTHLVATYRGVPEPLQNQVKEIAAGLEVTTGEVARALFEFALRGVAQDQLHFQAHPRGVRMTLYSPEERDERESEIRTWPPAKGGVKSRREKKAPPAWKRVVSYHGIPTEVQQGIKQIADRYTVPVGEVVTFLFEFSLKAIDQGELKLVAQPKVSSSLEWRDQD